jgi:hypothetical protein
MPSHTKLNPDLPPRYRLRNIRTGREVLVDARPRASYVDKETGEKLEVVGRLLPLDAAPSRLPWAVEKLRVCPSCGELVQKDLNYCPYDGRRLPPLDAVSRRTLARSRTDATA